MIAELPVVSTVLPPVIDASVVFLMLLTEPAPAAEIAIPPPAPPEPLRLGGRSLRDIRTEAIRFELRRQRGNVSGAARILGIARSTVYAALSPAQGSS